ncbi:MAG TPA: hypothetical protein DD383_05450 [Rikenellaceae bacterium]|nr:hypothetical protein [Rikenellaceae bacterium]
MSLILKCKTMSVKYDSSINVLGSIPDYLSMMDFICEYHGRAPEGQGSFAFRTHKTFARFEAAIKAAIMRFAGDEHKQLFLDALSSCDLSSRERLMVLFWQIVYCNPLFRRISEDVFMKAVYQARANLSALDVLALLHHIKETEKRELEWSEATLKMCASKYLTILKKLELADGAVKKRIIYPPMTSRLFVYFIRMAMIAYPDQKTLDNPMMVFSFYDKPSLIARLKRVEFIPFWYISQIGDEVMIELK